MSKIIAAAAIRGGHKILERAEKKYQEALEKWGPNQEVGFPNTGYYLPIIYGILGDPGEDARGHEASPGALPGSHPAPGEGESMAALPGPGPGRRHGHFLRRRDHRGHPLPGGPEFLHQGGRPHGRQHLAGRGRRRHPAETGHRVRRRHGARVRRHPGRGPDQGDRRQDRPGTSGEEPLRLHGGGARRENGSPSSWWRPGCRSAGRPVWSPSARTSRPPSSPWALPPGRPCPSAASPRATSARS